jgi:hypothetical protein
MTEILQQRPKSASSRPGVASKVSVSRLGFGAQAPAGAKVRREFCQPVRALAVEGAADLESALAEGTGLEPTDHCFVVFVPTGPPGEWTKPVAALLAPAERPDAARPFRVERGAEAIEWRPGVAVVQCRPESRNDVVAALVEFAFYEGQLRALEQAVVGGEAQAQLDVTLAHRILYRDRKHWDRLRDCLEGFSRTRLTFARLEPQLAAGSRALSLPARRWVSRLLSRADIEARLEALNDRLEALEDLYEGANQRISEYRWYREGHFLEMGIILILLAECFLMSGDIYVHYRDRPRPQQTQGSLAGSTK